MNVANRHNRVTVLCLFNRITLFYTLAPFLLTKDIARLLDFTQSLDHCLRRDRNRTLLIVRFFERSRLPDGRIPAEIMSRLRERYDRIAFFDDAAGGGHTRFEVLPYVDLYLKKHLYRELSTYRRPLYAREVFSDYYHHRFGVTDPEPHARHPLAASQESKLRLTWNLGVGSFPASALLQRIGVAAARMGARRLASSPYRSPLKYRPSNRGHHDVHARFGIPGIRPSVFFQRKLLLERVADDPRFLTGRAAPKQYQREIQHSRITLSPFGWGEVCFRDFEAVINESLLLKPAMDHLATWPDIYRPLETYVPVSWEGTDVIDRAAQYLQDTTGRRQIVRNALDAYHDALRAVSDRAHTVFDWIQHPDRQQSAAPDLSGLAAELFPVSGAAA
jgi:hypothetical protein